MRNDVLPLMLTMSLFTVVSCKNQEKDTRSPSPKPNVLFICVDDLRPELGCYGADYIKTPNIDQLAENGAVFLNHYANVPTCGASRYSMLTGTLPRAKGYLSNGACQEYISDKSESEVPVTFMNLMRHHGYYTVGIGKISHYADGLIYGYRKPVSDKRELPYSWDELVFDAGKWKTGWNAFFGYADGSNRQSRNGQVKPYEKGNVDDDGYVDGLTANLAIKKLKELKQKGKPFLLGVGFFKPHLPFNSPAKYWDLYDEDSIALTPSPDIPVNVNKASLHNSPEFNSYRAGDEKPSLDHPVSNAYQRKLRHAYYAAVSYSDAQIGKLLNELDKLGLAQNTIVVIWGDHGWQLGDHRVWGKHTIFERALKSALIIRAPGTTKAGEKIDRIVSSIDIYPTLMDLCGIEMPFKTDGNSLVPIMKDPSDKDWNDAAWGYYNRGISVRTPKYRLTKYYRDAEPVIELYDHQNDPWENTNIAAQHPELVQQLMPVLEKEDFHIY